MLQTSLLSLTLRLVIAFLQSEDRRAQFAALISLIIAGVLLTLCMLQIPYGSCKRREFTRYLKYLPCNTFKPFMLHVQRYIYKAMPLILIKS